MMKFYLDGTHPADPDPADPDSADPDPADPPTPAAAGATVRAGTGQMWSDVRRVRAQTRRGKMTSLLTQGFLGRVVHSQVASFLIEFSRQ